MNYPVNPDLMPALMAVFQHVRTRSRASSIASDST